MRSTEDPIPTDETSQHRESARARRRRSKPRGYVLPLGIDEVPDVVSRSGRRRRRHRQSVGSVEKFIGISALWIVLVVGAVIIEALSGQHWFFVGVSGEVPPPDQPIVISDAVLRADPLLNSLGSEVTPDPMVVVGGSLGEPELRWVRVAAVMLSVPLLYIVIRGARRIRRGTRG